MDSRRLRQLLAAVVTLLVIAVVWDMLADARQLPPPPVPVPDPPVVTTPAPPPRPSQAGSTEPRFTFNEAPENAPPREPPGYLEQLARAEARRQIRASGRYTYLNAILAQSADSVLHRWDNRTTSPVRVHLNASTVANFKPAFLDAVRAAFRRWQEAGVAVRFDFGADSARAEVRIQWRTQFEIDRTGQTDLTWDADGHHQSGLVTLATFNQLGQPMSVEEIRIVAMHEVGHVLGLDHSPDSTDLMYPVARVRDLSARDIQSAKLLYFLSPGSLR